MSVNVSTSSILRTPWEIYQVVASYFPSAEVTTQVDAAEVIRVTVTIPRITPPLVFSRAVDSQGFLCVIKDLYMQHQTDLRIGRETQCQLDEHRFSTAVPLRDWQGLRRAMYESAGTTCLDAILRFLHEPTAANLATLSFLGLAPEQLARMSSESDLAYFKQISQRLQRKEQRERDLIITNLKAHYPTILQRVLHDSAERSVTEEIRGRTDGYQVLLPRLRERVVGQDIATHELAATLASQTNQEKNQTFLFIGPTGVGKTELAKAVAQHKSSSTTERNQRLVTFAMQHYSDRHDVSKLFGSSSGYVGSTDEPHFVKEIKKYASSISSNEYVVKNVVLLFDEIEKAHQTVKQSLLTLFDEGKCSVSYSPSGGRVNITDRYTFKSCIFICTSNLFHDYILESFRRQANVEEIRKGFTELNRMHPDDEFHSTGSCSPEFIGRMTIIPFGPVPRGESYQRLLKGKLDGFFADFKKELCWKEIVIENEPEVLRALEEKLYGEGIDIRRVARYFNDVSALVYKEKSAWGELRTKKLTLTFEPERGLCLNVSAFNPTFACYSDNLFRVQLP